MRSIVVVIAIAAAGCADPLTVANQKASQQPSADAFAYTPTSSDLAGARRKAPREAPAASPAVRPDTAERAVGAPGAASSHAPGPALSPIVDQEIERAQGLLIRATKDYEMNLAESSRGESATYRAHLLQSIMAGNETTQMSVSKIIGPERDARRLTPVTPEWRRRVAEVIDKRVLERLKAPSTASFVGEREITIASRASGRSYLICAGEFDAQNGFGAMLRNRYVVAWEWLGDDPEGAIRAPLEEVVLMHER